MPRERAKLSEKQERILVQCQLMGLTTSDMTQISNRLRALDKEREFKQEVDKVTSGVTWKKESRGHYIVTESNGKVYEFKLTVTQGRRYWDKKEEWEIRVTHPGTRMKERIFKKESIWYSGDEVVSVCPEKDKRLFSVLKTVKSKRWDK